MVATTQSADGGTTDVRAYTPKRKWTIGRILNRTVFYLLIVFMFVYTLFPYVWAFLSSIRPNESIGLIPVQWWPEDVTWEHYRYVFSERSGFLPALLNSTIVSVTVVLISVALGASAAYALGRLKFRGRSFVLYTILSMTAFPAIAILGTLFQVIRQLQIYDTVFALIFSYLVFTLPFTVWTLTNFFKAMPGELEESALVDGATPFRAFWQILLPLSLPGLVTTGLLAFINAWNEFLFALTFTTAGGARTTPVVISSFSGNSQFDEPWGAIMAASVVVTLPLIVLVLIFQRLIIGGLTAGAVKG
ncbi:MAG TPA: carbohydrate ABC transporter permease [Thermomicrobiales bacterium]|jgi:trehalose/maltose transport system permease protein|nr:carbohydrate ABC transporter permease [Thermomicrobiales bacterium]